MLIQTERSRGLGTPRALQKTPGPWPTCIGISSEISQLLLKGRAQNRNYWCPPHAGGTGSEVERGQKALSLTLSYLWHTPRWTNSCTDAQFRGPHRLLKEFQNCSSDYSPISHSLSSVLMFRVWIQIHDTLWVTSCYASSESPTKSPKCQRSAVK